MSSWVAPAVAAEIWGINVEEVMRHIADGTIPSRTDGRFLFVDVAATGLPFPTSPGESQNLVTPQELTALAAPPPGEGELPLDIAQWRQVRGRTSQTRRAPRNAGSLG
jgi:hypothetical protein